MTNQAGNIAEILHLQAQKLGRQIAIIDGPLGHERQTSFRELEHQSAQFSAQLKSYNLKAGDVVLIFQPVTLELYVTLLAIFRLGLVAMFVDPSVGLEHLERCCQRVSPNALIASSKAHLLRFVSKALRRIPLKVAIGIRIPFTKNYHDQKRFLKAESIFSARENTPALITFTSGSTGLPKAAVRTHGFLLAQHRVLADNIDHHAGQVDVSTLPIFVLANLASGLTSLLCDVDLRYPGKVNADTVLQQVRKFKATRCAASPAFFEQLVAYCRQQNIGSLPFKRMDTGGAPVFPGLLKELKQLSDNAEVVAVYGSTEAEPIAHVHWQDISGEDKSAMQAGKGLLAGKPVSQIDVRVIQDQTDSPIADVNQAEFLAMTMDKGDIGEIVVAGDHVLPGYLNKVGNEQTKFQVDGRPWHRTGDAGYFDEDGRLWLLGRCSAKIIDQHGEIYPFAVETVVRSNVSVKRSAMVEHQKQRYLLIEAKHHHYVDMTALKKGLAWAKLDHVIKVKHIPVDKRHNAKIDYPAIRQLLNKMRK